MTTPISASGLVAFLCLMLAGLSTGKNSAPREEVFPPDVPTDVRFLAVGDINLGRAVGQRILEGDTTYPFAYVSDSFARYDVVFGNLECQLSDQNGETQHPRNNLIFTGPPAGGATLSRGGITHVSTANNHALDYGLDALRETIHHLRAAAIGFSGTSLPGEDLYAPALFEVKGLRFALYSCTDVMNMEDPRWRKYVAQADTGLLFPRIRMSSVEADFIILSYHGGAEYSERPSEATKRFARAALDAGADLFLGHHPHVPQGIEEVGEKLIVYSLGNFVFYQPFAFWTQRSFALDLTIQQHSDGARIRHFRCRPVIAATQPRFLESFDDRVLVHQRIDKLSLGLREGMPWPN